MLTSFLVAAVAATTASARIIGIAVPQTIKPGDGFNARILTENYIQSVADVAIAFGTAPGTGNQGGLGTNIGSYYLGPGKLLFLSLSVSLLSNSHQANFELIEQSNVVYNITKWVVSSSSSGKGPATLSAALYSLYGAAAAPTLTTYTVPISFGDQTSTTYVSSLGNVGS
jgi:hypothetical protein